MLVFGLIGPAFLNFLVYIKLMNVCSMHKVLHLSHCFKTPKICDKDVEKDSLILKFVLDIFKTQGMLLKSLLAIIHVPDQHKTQQMCENPF